MSNRSLHCLEEIDLHARGEGDEFFFGHFFPLNLDEETIVYDHLEQAFLGVDHSGEIADRLCFETQQAAESGIGQKACNLAEQRGIGGNGHRCLFFPLFVNALDAAATPKSCQRGGFEFTGLVLLNMMTKIKTNRILTIQIIVSLHYGRYLLIIFGR